MRTFCTPTGWSAGCTTAVSVIQRTLIRMHVAGSHLCHDWTVSQIAQTGLDSSASGSTSGSIMKLKIKHIAAPAIIHRVEVPNECSLREAREQCLASLPFVQGSHATEVVFSLNKKVCYGDAAEIACMSARVAAKMQRRLDGSATNPRTVSCAAWTYVMGLSALWNPVKL